MNKLFLFLVLLTAGCSSNVKKEQKLMSSNAPSVSPSFLKCAGLSMLSNNMNKSQKADFFAEAQFAQIAELAYDSSAHKISGMALTLKMEKGNIAIDEQMPISLTITENESSSESRMLAQFVGKGTLSKTSITGLRLVATESQQGVVLYAIDPTNIIRPIGQRCELQHEILNQILTK
jgi:hypothetical protein